MDATAGTVGIAFIVSVALVPLLVRFAIGRNLLDVPNSRSSHEVPTPRLGGLAIIVGVWAAAPLIGDGWLLVVAATLAGVVGVLDDLVDLRFWMKAVGQGVMALGLLLMVPPPLVADAPGPLKVAAVAFGVLWLVSIVNAYNFMDGIDGIAGGTAILNAVFLTVIGGVAAGALPALTAAVAGFLLWNLSPARIFLGDSGSYFIGFMLGAVALYASPAGLGPYLSFVVSAAVFTPFLFDTAYTLVRRARAKKYLFSAHREHIYQRITPDPAKHRQVSIIYFALAAVSGLGASLAANGTLAHLLAGGVLVAACCVSTALLPGVLGEEGNTRSRPDGGSGA